MKMHFANEVRTFLRGTNHSKKISYTFCENPIVYPKIVGNPFVLGKISYAICKSELPLGFFEQQDGILSGNGVFLAIV